MKKSTAPAPTAIDLANQALMELAGSLEAQAILAKLIEAQAATEREGTWNTETGHRVESAMGNLRMALEAAGRRF